MEQKVLLVDDDEDLRALLALKLTKEGLKVLTAANAEAGLDLVRTKAPDIVILDVNMPGMNGLEACKILRAGQKTKSIPIIMLTAKSDEVDRVMGLEFGADDYVGKPFNVRELVLRIKSVLKRAAPADAAENAVKAGVLSIDMNSREVRVKNKPVTLTLTEFNLLVSLAEHPGQVRSRDWLLDRIWEYGDGVFSRTIDTHIQRLRSKLKEAGKYIKTVRGVGYRFDDG